MSNKKSKNNNKNSTPPFSNEVKFLKFEFKKMIDEMPDDEFIDMIYFLMYSSDAFEEEWTMDEEWEDEAEKFYKQGNKNSNNNLKLLKNDDDLLF